MVAGILLLVLLGGAAARAGAAEVPGRSGASRTSAEAGSAVAAFADASAGLLGTVEGSAAWGDYDGDGDLDLVVTGFDASLAWVTRLYRNEGGPNPAFTSVTTSLPGLSIGSTAWGDYDQPARWHR